MPMYRVHIVPEFVTYLEAASLEEANRLARQVDLSTCDDVSTEYHIEELTPLSEDLCRRVEILQDTLRDRVILLRSVGPTGRY